MRGSVTIKHALFVELILLLVTLALQAWALRILCLAISFSLDRLQYDVSSVPFAQLYTYTQTVTVTGYRSTSTASASLSYYAQIATQTTSSRHAFTVAPKPVGFDPTGQTVRTITVTGMQDIRAGAHNGDLYAALATPISAASFIARQASSKGVTLADSQVWSSPTSTPPDPLQQYKYVTANHGFGAYFVEGGIEYDYGFPRNLGYSFTDYQKISALAALLVLSIVAVLGRIGLWIYTTTGRGNRLNWLNVGFALLLCVTYLPFWIIYGVWTHRSPLVDEAVRAFDLDEGLYYLNMNDLLDTRPWTGTTKALIVFWTLSVLSSWTIALYGMLTVKGRRAEPIDVHEKGASK